jgi:GTPase SAR1 family protein
VGFVFDVTNSESFKSVDGWLEVFLERAGFDENLRNYPIVLIGNKEDLTD